MFIRCKKRGRVSGELASCLLRRPTVTSTAKAACMRQTTPRLAPLTFACHPRRRRRRRRRQRRRRRLLLLWRRVETCRASCASQTRFEPLFDRLLCDFLLDYVLELFALYKPHLGAPSSPTLRLTQQLLKLQRFSDVDAVSKMCVRTSFGQFDCLCACLHNFHPGWPSSDVRQATRSEQKCLMLRKQASGQFLLPRNEERADTRFAF